MDLLIQHRSPQTVKSNFQLWNHHNSASTSTCFKGEFSCCHYLRMSVSIWSAKGEVKERFSSRNKGTSESFQNSDSPETAMLWQFSKVTRHQLPSRTVLPFDPTGKCCHPLHLTSPTCWPVGAAQVFGELPKGSLTAMLQCCTCLVSHHRGLNTSRQGVTGSLL